MKSYLFSSLKKKISEWPKRKGSDRVCERSLCFFFALAYIWQLKVKRHVFEEDLDQIFIISFCFFGKITIATICFH